MIESNYIYFFGSGNTNTIANYAAYQFTHIGFRTVTNVSPEMQLSSAYTMGENDLCFAISDSGSSTMIMDIANIVKNKGNKIISLIGHQISPLSKLSDYVLPFVSNDKTFFESTNSSYFSAMVIIDLLINLLSQDNRIDAKETVYEREKFLSKYKY